MGVLMTIDKDENSAGGGSTPTLPLGAKFQLTTPQFPSSQKIINHLKTSKNARFKHTIKPPQ